LGSPAQHFGFVQLELAGTLGIADGRYLARAEGEEEAEAVLVLETLGAPPPPGRRRRGPRETEPAATLAALPLTRATAVRAAEPFESAESAARWLEEAVETEERLETLVGEAVGLLNRALHAQAVASADPSLRQVRAEQAVLVRIGHGSGEEVASGRFTLAREVDVGPAGSRRRRRQDELRPQERVAAVLAGRERLDACETLLLRARADLECDRLREAALQLEVSLEALLAELEGALADPAHARDMTELRARAGEAGVAARQAVRGPLDAQREREVRELTALCERVLRRRSVLRG